jgi:uncharacterized RDD family membrane protein YckC
MSCPLCGEICRCFPEGESSASLRSSQPETPVVLGLSVPSQALAEIAVAIEQEKDLSPDAREGDDSSAWRRELSARLNRYHSRRKPRPPRYPSLQLKFEPPSTFSVSGGNSDLSCLASSSNQALAFAEVPSISPTPIFATAPLTSTEILNPPDEAEVKGAAPTSIPTSSAKIIEFPRSWAQPALPLNQLAEPVITTPRILEAPEIPPAPPALGGITIEPPKVPPIEKRPGIDIPLQSAALARRISAAVIDSLLIASACALFAFIFWKLTAIQPPRIQIVGIFAGLAALFWSAYQYLLIVHAGTTPGLRLARLELCRFDGSPARRGLRRWRVLASFLSAGSLGMGYLWVFLDEDSLCWHDRITRTYLSIRSKS